VDRVRSSDAWLTIGELPLVGRMLGLYFVIDFVTNRAPGLCFHVSQKKQGLHVEFEEEDVAIFDNVLFAFGA
jgi:hypothetical protein